MPKKEIVKVEIWRFPNISTRKQRIWYVEESMTHPAKMNVALARKILKEFTKPGDTVLDPMAGCGTTLVEAILLGRNAVGVDIEKKFCNLMKKNIEKVERTNKKSRFPLKLGKAIVINTDARKLSQVLIGKTDAVVTSLPFGKAQSGGGIAKEGYHNEAMSKGVFDPIGKRSYIPENIGKSDSNISNLPHRKKKQFDLIITSPPYGEMRKGKTVSLEKAMEIARKKTERYDSGNFLTDGRIKGLKTLHSGYGRNKNNIGNLPHGKIDTIITSPPYAESIKAVSSGHQGPEGGALERQHIIAKQTERMRKLFAKGKFRRKGTFLHVAHPSYMVNQVAGYSINPENIGNLAYGIVDAIITSPPYSEGIGHAQGELGKRQTGEEKLRYAWRIELAKKYREQWSEENIAILPHGKIDAVITSPPYEASISPGKENFVWVGRRGFDPKEMELMRKTDLKRYKKIRRNSGYSENKDNIGNLPRGNVDAILTSPPYEATLGFKQGGASKKAIRFVEEHKSLQMKRSGLIAVEKNLPYPYSTSEKQIGNLSKETYLSAMLKVYRECWKVLKPNGLMILVLKNFIRNYEVIDLVGDTIKLCQAVGFKLKRRIHHILNTKSFWRINYAKQWEKKFGKPFPEDKFASVYNYETVLIFEKLEH
jgi:DNA modification methylase